MNPFLDPTSSPASEPSETPKVEAAADVPPAKPRKPRGFAAMDRKRVSEIASKGGKAAHAAGTAHQFTSDEARNAGRKGGVAPHVRRGRGPRQTPPTSTPTPDSSGEALSMEISGVNNLSHLLAQQTNTVKANTANVDADGDFDGDSGVDTDKDAASVSAKVALPSNVGKNVNFYA